VSRAQQIEEMAARFLVRRDEPDWSDADAGALQTWLDASLAHKAAYWRLEHGWMRAGRLAALRSPPAPARRTGRRNAAFPAMRTWRPLAVAASLVAAIAVGTMMVTGSPSPQAKTYATDVGGRESVPLADGSRMELNTSTTVRARVTRGQRQVWLDRGEAYFEVAHDARRPFTIMAGPRRVVVVGTRFSVRHDGGRVAVAVVDGRVRVEPGRPGMPAATQVLTRGDVILVDGSSIILTHKPVEQVAEALSWRTGMLTFDQTTLADAAAEFNRYNRKQVVVRGKAAGLRIGGAFEAGNVDAFARLLRQAYGLEVDDDGARVTVG
jgi:transmembrane sensor